MSTYRINIERNEVFCSLQKYVRNFVTSVHEKSYSYYQRHTKIYSSKKRKTKGKKKGKKKLKKKQRKFTFKISFGNRI